MARNSRKYISERSYTQKKMILWQKDIKIAEAKRVPFIEHVVKNYYAPLFKELSSDELVERISFLIDENKTDEGQGFIMFKLPLKAVIEPTTSVIKEWEEYCLDKETKCYYKPLPSFDEEGTDGCAIDEVFAIGDGLIEKLPSLVDSGSETFNSYQTHFYAVRDNEKKAFSEIQSALAESNKLKEGLKKKLDDADSEKRKAIEKVDNHWNEKYNTLCDQYQTATKQISEYKQEWDDEKAHRIAAEREVQEKEKIIKERDQMISRKDEEMKEYSVRAVFFLSAQTFCQKVMNLFDLIDNLLYHANQLKVNLPSGVNADDYNYYLTRIERKYYSTKVTNLNEWRREIQMLSLTGMAPSNGLIDSKLGIDKSTGKYKVNESQWVSTLKMLLYQSVMMDLAGAAVTMSDELAYMLPHMVPGVASNKVFVEITESLKKTIKDLGYDLNYVKPFTQLSNYQNVENVKFTDADVPQGTIFEIMKMALNYGSTKKKTEVSAK